MKTLALELPERLTEEIDALVQNGWFADENELIRAALWEFVRRKRLVRRERLVRRNRFILAEQFQRADIAWAEQYPL